MTTNNSSEESLAETLIAGAKKHITTTSSLVIGGVTLTPAQVEASLQTIIDLLSGVSAAKAATQAKLVAWKAQAPSLRSQMAAFVAYVRASYGNSPDVLADFGLKPRKAKTPLTTVQRAAAAAKRAATRAARHTMGKVQKKSVKGTVTTIVSPAPTTAPEPVATGGGVTSVPASPAASGAPATHPTTT